MQEIKRIQEELDRKIKEEGHQLGKLRLKVVQVLFNQCVRWVDGEQDEEEARRIIEHYRELFDPKAPPMTVKVPESGQTEFKIGRGGRRVGAGRPASGKAKRKPSISLLPEQWAQIDGIQRAEGSTQSETLAELLALALEIRLVDYMDKDGNLIFRGDENHGND